MRLALVHLRHAASGGTERYTDRLARYLAERGHDVTIVCRSHGEAPHPRVGFVRLRPTAVGGAWRFWSFARAVERHVLRERYDVVYGLGRTWSQDVLRLGGGCQGTYLERAHAATRTPLERALRLGSLKQRAAVALEERALAARFAERRLRGGGAAEPRVVVNSEMVKRDVLARYGLPTARVQTIHNGVDLKRFRPSLAEPNAAGGSLRTELGLAVDDLAVLFLGTGYARKGLDLVLEAFPRAAAGAPNARLVVAGYDSDRPRYEARAAQLGIAERTRFLGGRSDPEAVYAACDLYVLPTRYDPFANSTLEALASGLPVITSTSNGGAELITPGVEGAAISVDGTNDEVAARLGTELSAWVAPHRAREARPAARALAERHGEAEKFALAEAQLAVAAEERLRRA